MLTQENNIIVEGKRFRLYLKSEEIATTVARVASEVSHDYAGVKDEQGRGPLLLPILNGAYMFAADLTRCLTIDAEICFVKMTSYAGTTSTGKVKELIGFPGDLRGRHVILVEDIVDTGISMGQVLQQLHALGVASARICTFLFKPGKFQEKYKVDYIGRAIDNDFIIGYGMDYNEYGRFYKDIYIVDECDCK